MYEYEQNSMTAAKLLKCLTPTLHDRQSFCAYSDDTETVQSTSTPRHKQNYKTKVSRKVHKKHSAEQNKNVEI